MMTPAMLERATPAFRRGYHDRLAGRDNRSEYTADSFGAADYAEGRNAMMAEERARNGGVLVHTFESVDWAYNDSQCDDTIRNGDVLAVPDYDSPIFPVAMGGTMTPGAVAVLCRAWPVAVTLNAGGFHAPADDFNWRCFQAHETDSRPGDYAASVRVAVAEARRLGLAVHPAAAAVADDDAGPNDPGPGGREAPASAPKALRTASPASVAGDSFAPAADQPATPDAIALAAHERMHRAMQHSSTRADFRHAFRAVRILRNYKLAAPAENHAGVDPAVFAAAIRALFWRHVRQFGVEACRNGTAPDFREAVRLNLESARYRKRTGYAVRQCAKRFGM